MNLFFYSFSTQIVNKIQKTSLKELSDNKPNTGKNEINNNNNNNEVNVPIEEVSKYINSSEFLFYVLRRKQKNNFSNFKVLPDVVEHIKNQPKNNIAIAKYVCKDENNSFNYFAYKNFKKPLKVNNYIQVRIKQINLFKYVFATLGTTKNDQDFDEYIKNIEAFGASNNINLSIMTFKFRGNSYVFDYNLTNEEMRLLSEYSFLFQNPIFSSEIVDRFIKSIRKEDMLKLFRPDGKILDINDFRTKYLSKIFGYLYSTYY